MPLVTRILPPDAKNAKLTFQEMDNNLYYLQSLGVSGLTFSANTLTITNPTGGTKSVTINSVTGLTVNGNLTVTGNTSLQGLTATTISATTTTTDDFIFKTTYVPTGSTDPTGSIGSMSWSGNSFYVKTNTSWVKFTGLTSW